GMKAIFNKWDVAVYEAVRALSIAKEVAVQDSPKIQQLENALASLLENQGQPSELAMLTRLHWWTVEYGLVGNTEKSDIFGAGLLSSLGESKHCLDERVLKRPLTVEAVLSSYDITEEQPQLFVTKSCRHLTQVLDEYAVTMCYQVGGSESIQTAVDAGIVTTCEYSSGLQVSGKFNRLIRNALGSAIYIGSTGPTQLSIREEELPGHGINYHSEGFGSPVGRVCNLMKPPEDASEYDLQMLGIKRGCPVRLEFLSGVCVQGRLDTILKENGKLVLFSFSDCLVTGPDGEVLFDPTWGSYDMAVGERINSVFAGSADSSNYDVYPPKLDNIAKAEAHSNETLDEFELHTKAAEYRKLSGLGELSEGALEDLIQYAQIKSPNAWLVHLELYELALGLSAHVEKTENYLNLLGKSHKVYEPLIIRGRDLLKLNARGA
ncbi:MAG: phenylalanine-4-hydroxylase, partial [Candidatus Azotimanducaceae bacterium]